MCLCLAVFRLVFNLSKERREKREERRDAHEKTVCTLLSATGFALRQSLSLSLFLFHTLHVLHTTVCIIVRQKGVTRTVFVYQTDRTLDAQSVGLFFSGGISMDRQVALVAIARVKGKQQNKTKPNKTSRFYTLLNELRY